jgi:dTDP-4-dehydrorhamnose 3,5-epimerase
MNFRPLSIPGAYLIESEPSTDERGSFERIWCAREFELHGLSSRLVQCNISTNRRQGTLRGMHYSVPPRAETKVVRCVKGSVFDVLLDLRPSSETYRKWVAEILSRDNARAVFVPQGVAHGFQTLEDETDILYEMSEFYDPQCARGARWNDPAFDIAWPLADPILSGRDRETPDFHV